MDLKTVFLNDDIVVIIEKKAVREEDLWRRGREMPDCKTVSWNELIIFKRNDI